MLLHNQIASLHDTEMECNKDSGNQMEHGMAFHCQARCTRLLLVHSLVIKVVGQAWNSPFVLQVARDGLGEQLEFRSCEFGGGTQE